MSFYKTAYDTTVGRGMEMSKTVGAIKLSLLSENFALANNKLGGIDMPVPQDGVVPSVITTLTESEMSIPVFAHPIFVDLSEVRRSPVETYMISDARSFMVSKPLDRNGNLITKNSTEFNFVKNRTILSSHWYKRNVDAFKHLGSCLPAIYSSWISEAISRRFGLDPKDQHYLQILAAYLYLSLFYYDSKFDENDKVKLAAMIAKVTHAEVPVVFEILDRFPSMEGIYDFCEYAKLLTENPRLEDLNPGLLVTMISNSWFGTNARDIAAVAMEHVPTFVMMIYSAFTERTYKHASLTKITDRFKDNKGENDFLRSLKALMNYIKTK